MASNQKHLICRVTRVVNSRKPQRHVTILAVPFTGDRLSVEMELEDRAHRRQHRIEFLGEASGVTTASSLTEAFELV